MPMPALLPGAPEPLRPGWRPAQRCRCSHAAGSVARARPARQAPGQGSGGSPRGRAVCVAAYREEYAEQARRGAYEPGYGPQYAQGRPSQPGQYSPPAQAPDRSSLGQREQQRRALAPPQRPRQRPARRIRPPPPDEQTLSCQTVLNKEVITRTSGRSLGVVSELFADPDSLTIVSADLRAKGLSLGTGSAGNLLLDAICQVGDVVLVHDEGALDFVPQDASLGFINVIGYPVLTADGTSVGRVREFTFSPETGRLDLLKYDALGWPAVPERLVGAWQVGVECVDCVAAQGIFLLPGAEAQLQRVSEGPLEAALLALQSLFQDAGQEDLADGATDYEYERWKQQYGAAFARAYGQPPPATRREMDMFNQGLESARPPPSAAAPRQQPRALPPPRSAAMADVLQPARRERERVPVGAPREDPRRRQAVPQQQRRPPPQQQQQQQWGPPPQQGARVASVPIVDRSIRPAYQQRDADGGLGEPQRYQPAQPSGQMIEDWIEAPPPPQQQPQPQREPVMQGYGAAPQQAAGSGRGSLAAQPEELAWGESPGPSQPAAPSWQQQQGPGQGRDAPPQWAPDGGPGEARQQLAEAPPPGGAWPQGNGAQAGPDAGSQAAQSGSSSERAAEGPASQAASPARRPAGGASLEQQPQQGGTPVWPQEAASRLPPSETGGQLGPRGL